MHDFDKKKTRIKDQLIRTLVIVFGIFYAFSNVAQSDSVDYYIDSNSIDKKLLKSNYHITFGLSTHEYEVRYTKSQLDFVQVETCLGIHIGYQYINDYFKIGAFGMKGFFHAGDQPPGQNGGQLLSKPWILKINSAGNFFYKRKRKFFLGPVVGYQILYDSRYNHINQFIELGGHLRKKWFMLEITGHKFIYTKNNHVRIYDERGVTWVLGVIIPMHKVVSLKK